MGATCLASLLLTAPAAAAQRPANATQQSYERARRVLDAGLQALGGEEALRSIQSFTVRAAGTDRLVNQSPRPQPPFLTTPRSEIVVVDTARGHLFNEVRAVTPWFTTQARTIIKGREGFTLDLLSKTITPIANPSLANFRRLYRYLPHFVLLEALERAPSLRWVGEGDFRGRKQRVVSAVLADGQQWALYFDAGTDLLTKYEFIYTDPVHGDSVSEIIFPGYRAAGRLQIPTGRAVTFAGEVLQETKYEAVQFDGRPEDGLFETPRDFERVAAAPQPQNVLHRIADDVYWLQGVAGTNNNVLFVAFGDHVLVAEAPEQRPFANLSDQVIAKIKETVPGKPIKYLVPTHYHWDHAAGARSYIAEGATIVTTPGNRRFFESLARARFGFALDALARRPRPAVVEAVQNKKRVFGGGGRVVELYDIGPAPHAEEMLVVYLPKEKILFQGDLVNSTHGPLPVAQESTVHLDEKIKELGLDVERIIGAHGRAVTLEEMREAIEKRRRLGMK
jgi:glyoxylase-like metal-dependent hydrolase (beta-lactamase superfamily II)